MGRKKENKLETEVKEKGERWQIFQTNVILF